MQHTITTMALLALLSLGAQSAAAETRETLTKEGYSAQRGETSDVPQFKVNDDAPAMKSAHGDKTARKAPGDARAKLNQDFWIFDASTRILDDFDRDGFYTRIELTFDADTVYESADVFAVLYLSLEGGDWIEYGSTSVFSIYGNSGTDEYYFDSDLVSGFPTGYYDVLIDLYDDFDGQLVASFGPAESADLFDLPLESQSLDSSVETIVVVSEEGGGATGIAALGLLGLLALRRRLARSE